MKKKITKSKPELKIINRVGFKNFSNSRLDLLFKKTLKLIGHPAQKGTIELYFIDNDSIKKLNNKYRNKNKVTDVLSFSYFFGPAFPYNNLLGQIFIAPAYAKTHKTGIYLLFVHGLLHIFGFVHDKKGDFEKMSALQNKIIS